MDHFYPGSDIPFPDLHGWRLRFFPPTRKEWVYLKTEKEREEWPLNDVEKAILNIPLDDSPPPTAGTTPKDAARNGYHYLKRAQGPDGHWPSFCSGIMFIIPQYVITHYLLQREIPQEEQLEMIRYTFFHANKDDGGWGLHLEDTTSVFCTALNYVSLRLLGVDPQHPAMVKARNTLHRLGGAIGCPAWGRFWLSIMNLSDWEGNNPIPPEVWLVPSWTPVHPGKWWLFIRAFYTPMSYIYGLRVQAPVTKLILELRKEIYIEDYDTIDWPSIRFYVAPADALIPRSFLLDTLYKLAHLSFETCQFPPLRKYAMEKVYEQIVFEDDNSDCFGLISVHAILQVICRAYGDGFDSPAVNKHMAGIKEYLWMGPDGMQVCVTNGTQVWDTSFIAHAAVETGVAELPENQESVIKILRFLNDEYISYNTPHFPSDFRQATKGAWPYSTRRENGYTVSDCTGEAFKAYMILSPKIKAEERLTEANLRDTVDMLLGMQAADGGFPAYESDRGSKLLEYVNPTEVFDDTMVEYSYVECSVSVAAGLHEFRRRYTYRSKDIDRAIARAVKFIYSQQDPDGGWCSSWGICFTYGAWFALRGLAELAGETYESNEKIQKACHFLVKHQRSDGGWSEHPQTARKKYWIQTEKANMAQTSWAAIALISAKYPDKRPIERAVKLVMDTQLPDGSWPIERGAGLGLRCCVLPYPLYRLTFPTWFLGIADEYLKSKKD